MTDPMPSYVRERVRDVIVVVITFLVVCGLLGVGLLILRVVGTAHAKNWDRDEILTEMGRLRSAYLSQAGTLMTGGRVSCCGEADGYEADTVIEENGTAYAVLTCNDPDNCKEVSGKVVRAPGERHRIPPDKVLAGYGPVNDTGHGWVWISPTSTDFEGKPLVYCYANPGGA